jgi:capsular exopolysaccharide synthesis family protein
VANERTNDGVRMARPHNLKVFRRRWRVILACFVLATVTGYILSPEKPAAPKGSGYQASVTLVSAPDATTPPNLYLAAYLVTTPDVASLAAEQLPAGIRPKDDAAITANVDPDAGALTIAATDLDENSAVILAQAYGAATIQFFNTATAGSREGALAAAKKELKSVDKNLQALGAERAANPEDAVLQAKLDTEIARYAIVFQRVQDLLRAEGGPAPLQVIGTPEVAPLEGGVISAPQDRRARALLAGVLGLVLGLGVALAVDRLDNRLRERDQVEEAFGLPVLGEIPRISRRRRKHHAVVTAVLPGSAAAEAYRSLRSAITLVAQSRRSDGAAASAREIPQGHQVLVVTAARGQEGKSTTVVNLAAAFAEANRNVIVIDCDFRKPDAHLFLGAAAGRGLTDAVEPDFDGDFDKIIEFTAISGVRLITNGQAVSQPAGVLPRLAGIVAEARRRADIVLIDSSPLLAVSDAVDVLQYADAAVVVCQLGHTTDDQARRSRLALQRADVPVLGVVLTGTQPTRGTPYGQPSKRKAFQSSLRRWAQELGDDRQQVPSSTSEAAPAAQEPAGDETRPDIREIEPFDEPPKDRPEPPADQQEWQELQTEDRQTEYDQAENQSQPRRYQRRHKRAVEPAENGRNSWPESEPAEFPHHQWHEAGQSSEDAHDESPDELPETRQEAAWSGG